MSVLENAEMLSGFTALDFTSMKPGTATRSMIPTVINVIRKVCIAIML